MGTVMSGGDNSGRGLSGGIWSGFPLSDLQRNPEKGVYFFDDFLHFPVAGTITTVANVGDYMAFAGTDGNVAAGTSTQTGALYMTTDSDDDGDSCSIQSIACPFLISGIAGSKTGKLCFEARIKLSTIADTKNEAFIGLADACTLAEAVPITDTAATLSASNNYLGFYRTESDGDKWSFVYKADGVTIVVCHATLATPVADTYMKLGFVFDPRENTLKAFVNGVQTGLTTPIISTQLGATAGTDFPNDAYMGLIAAIRNATASTPGTQTIDWWACGQLAV